MCEKQKQKNVIDCYGDQSEDHVIDVVWRGGRGVTKLHALSCTVYVLSDPSQSSKPG